MRSNSGSISSRKGVSFLSSGSSVCQPVPIFPSMSRAISGLLSSSQRRGVMPLVMLTNFSGYRSYQFLKVCVFKMFVWISATPLTCDDT